MKKKIKKKSKIISIKLFLKNVKRTLAIYWKMSRWLFILSFLLLLTTALLPFAASFVGGRMINNIVEFLKGNDGVKVQIFIFFGISVGIGFLLNVFGRLEAYVDQVSYLRWSEYMSVIVTDKLSKLDISKYEDPKFNTLLNKVRDGYEYKPANFALETFGILTTLVEIVTATIILFTLSPIILPIILLSLVPEFILSMKGSRSLWGIWAAKGEVNKKYYESRANLTHEKSIKETRIFGSQSYILNMMTGLLRNFKSEQEKIMNKQARLSMGTKTFEQIVGSAIEFWILLKVIGRTIDLGTYTFYTNTINRFSSGSRRLLNRLNRMYEYNLFMTDLFKVLDIKNSIYSDNKLINIDTDKVPSVEFKNVSFKYPGSDEYVFKDFSLKINPGEDIAIVGENGAGKSTFVKLLVRFYDVTDGQILVNGVDIREINLDSWYKNIGALFQDYNAYFYSVKENIALGDVDRFDDENGIIEAAQNSGAEASFIKGFKNKYNQILGKHFNKGTDLSGGQWQRLALARGFFRNANILILDEPTSAIDAKGEYEIFKKISEVQKEKTTIIISHRFSTVKKAHKIYVVEHGKIIENGTHQELMTIENGKYKEMFELQAEGYK